MSSPGLAAPCWNRSAVSDSGRAGTGLRSRTPGGASMLWRIIVRPFQRRSIPFPQIGCRFISFLEETEQKPVWIVRLSNGVIGQDEQAQIIVVSRCGRAYRCLCIALRFGIRIGKECRLSIASIAGPEAAAADFMRIGFLIGRKSDVGRVPRRQGSAPAGKARDRQIETAPEKMDRAHLSKKRRAKELEHAIALDQRSPKILN